MPNIIITKGTYDKFLALRPVFKHLLDAFIAENSIQIVYSITNTITYNELASKFVKFVFEKIQLTNLVDEEKICLAVKTYGNQQAIQHHYINFDYANHTITWRGEVYHLEPNVLVHFKASEKSSATEAGVYDPSAVMVIIKKQIMKAERVHVVDDIIAKLQGSLIVAENDYAVGGIQKSNGKYHDRIRVMLDNKVVAVGIAIDTSVDKSFCREYNHVLGLKVVKTDIRPQDIKVVQSKFGTAISDKNNKKCFYVGDGVNAAFVTRVEDHYLTLNPTDNVAKLANRIGSHKFIPAKLENAEASRLVSQLSDGQLATTYGMPLTTIIHDGGFNNGSGAAVCTKPIHYIIDKTLRAVFAIDQLDQGYLNSLSRNREQQLEQIGTAVITYLKSLKGTDLEPGEAIEWKGVEIVRNRHNFPVTIDSIRLKKGYFLNTECRSIKVEVRTFCHRYDYNAKLRGNLKKLQTIHQPGTKVYTVDGKPIDFDIMLNGENVKGVIPNLEIYANSFVDNLVFGTDGKLYRNSLEITEDEIKSWIEANTKQIVIEQIISAEYFAQYKSEFDKRGDKYVANADGTYTLKSTVNAIIGTAHYAVELSSNPENFTDSYQGVPGQMMLSTMNGNIRSAIVKHQEAAAKNLDLFDLSAYSAEFNLTHTEDRAEFDEKLNLKGTETIEMIFKKLAQKWAKGISLSVVVNNYTYSVCIPTKLLYHYIAFDSSGYPLNEQEMMNNIVSLLKLCSTAGADVVLIKEYMFYVKAYLERWVKDIEGSKNSFVRGNRAIKSFGMKVITSADIGCYAGIPEIVVNPLNPLVTGNSPLVYKKDGLREGSIVLFYRNPLPFFTPGIIRFSENVDPLVMGMSPLVGTKACSLDSDGDTVFLIPMSRFGIADNNIKGAKELLDHSLGMELFNRVLEGETPIEDFVTGKPVLPEKFVSNVSIEEFNHVLGAVNKHYSIRVGQGYSLMHDAICSFVDKHHRGEYITENELIAIKRCAFLFYEEYGLGGYKPESEEQFALLEEKANEVIREKKSNGSAIEDYIVAAMVRTIIARAEETNGLWHPDLYDQAIQNGVIRCLSKGHLTYEGVLSNLFAAYTANPVKTNHPFFIALNAYSQFFANDFQPIQKELKVKSVFGSWN